MIVALRMIFSGVLISMLIVTTWASSQVALWDIPRSVGGHPWFIATLFDTYFAFLTFWAWVVYQEGNWTRRLAWLLAILVLGNIAMATYILMRLFRLPKDASLEQVILRSPP